MKRNLKKTKSLNLFSQCSARLKLYQKSCQVVQKHRFLALPKTSVEKNHSNIQNKFKKSNRFQLLKKKPKEKLTKQTETQELLDKKEPKLQNFSPIIINPEKEGDKRRKKEKEMFIVNEINETIWCQSHQKTEILKYKTSCEILENELKYTVNFIKELKAEINKINEDRSEKEKQTSYNEQNQTQIKIPINREITTKVLRPFCHRNCKEKCSCLMDQVRISYG